MTVTEFRTELNYMHLILGRVCCQSETSDLPPLHLVEAVASAYITIPSSSHPSGGPRASPYMIAFSGESFDWEVGWRVYQRAFGAGHPTGMAALEEELSVPLRLPGTLLRCF